MQASSPDLLVDSIVLFFIDYYLTKTSKYL